MKKSKAFIGLLVLLLSMFLPGFVFPADGCIAVVNMSNKVIISKISEGFEIMYLFPGEGEESYGFSKVQTITIKDAGSHELLLSKEILPDRTLIYHFDQNHKLVGSIIPGCYPHD